MESWVSEMPGGAILLAEIAAALPAVREGRWLAIARKCGWGRTVVARERNLTVVENGVTLSLRKAWMSQWLVSEPLRRCGIGAQS